MTAEVPIGQQYNRAVIGWQVSISEFEEAVVEAANALADYRLTRGKFITRMKFEQPKASQVVLEAAAEGDDEVSNALHRRLLAEGVVDGLKARLLWHRAQADNLRTQVVDEREQNRLSSSAGAGPGRGQVEPSWSTPSDRRRPPAGRSALPPGAGPYTDEPPPYGDDDAPPVRDWSADSERV